MGKRSRLGVLLLLALLTVVGFAVSATAHAKVRRDFVGITSEDVFAGGKSYRARQLRRQSRVRIGLIRQTFHWRGIERSPGVYSLGRYDRYVLAAARRRISILPVLFDAPRFYTSQAGRAACPPGNPAVMANFARALVRRYGPAGTLWRSRPRARKVPIRAWQVWNEPSLDVYWCGNANAPAYAAMLKRVGAAIKAADPRAEVVTGGLPPSKLRSAVPLRRYVGQLYSAGAAASFDTLAINSYARNAGELRRLLRSVRRLMNRRGDRRARIWVTELGWGDKGPRHRFIVGRRGQARRIRSALSYIRRARRSLRLRGFVYFSWRDGRPYAPRFKDLWGLHTGLLTRSGRRKPAYRAFRLAVRRMRR
jgi:hypothetical protein